MSYAKTDINLESGVYVVDEIISKTQSTHFKKYKVGDEIMFSVELKGQGRASKAFVVKCVNITQNFFHHEYVNRLSSLISDEDSRQIFMLRKKDRRIAPERPKLPLESNEGD